MAKRILFVFGTRPEAIKMAPVIALAKGLPEKLQPIVCVTAQHRYLLDQALAEFKIQPDIDLDLMQPNQSLEGLVAAVIKGIREVCRKVQPQLVLVQGDTSTVFATSLAAYYENIDIGHIEAGLRSGNLRHPFPEEVNRRFVSLVARYNFCPTPVAKKNLLREGIGKDKIFVTGNTVVDAFQQALESVRTSPPPLKSVRPEFLRRPYVLITGHRRESFGQGMKNVCMAIKSLAKSYPACHWLWAVHLNPNARKIVFATLGGLANVKLIAPPAYREFVYLMDRCQFIISDSGGVQEEAPSIPKKVLVTRLCTERPEAIRLGTSVLVGTAPRKIIQEVAQAMKAKPSRKINNPFGDGRAAQRIIDVITRGACREFQWKR